MESRRDMFLYWYTQFVFAYSYGMVWPVKLALKRMWQMYSISFARGGNATALAIAACVTGIVVRAMLILKTLHSLLKYLVVQWTVF